MRKENLNDGSQLKYRIHLLCFQAQEVPTATKSMLEIHNIKSKIRFTLQTNIS